MKFSLLNIIFQIIIVGYSYSQYSLDWAKGFGGDKKDKANCIIETSDGNLMLAGTVMQRRTHLWLLKMDTNGNEIWGKTYEDNFCSGANSCIQTLDTCLIAAGFITQERSLANTNAWILKTDFSGKILWQKQYGKNGDEELNKIIQTKDGNILAVGFSMSNSDFEKEIFIIKVRNNGDEIWSKNLDYTTEDVANSVCETIDGGFIIVGYSVKNDKKVLTAFKIDSDGNEIWSYPYNYNDIQEAYDIVQSLDTCYLIVGNTKHRQIDNTDYLIQKISAQGDSIWTKIQGTGKWEEATSITRMADGNLAITGYERTNAEMNSDFIVKKINNSGEIIWEDVFVRSSLEFPNSIIETRDNGIISAGATYSKENGWDYAVLKYMDDLKTYIKINSPSDSLITTTNADYEFDACLRSYSVLKNVQIIVNGSLQYFGIPDNNFISDNSCKFPLLCTLKLQPGVNEIKIIVTDSRDFVIIKYNTICYIPQTHISW